VTSPAKGTAVAKKPMSFDELLEWAKPKIAAVLPKHITPERMVALVTLAAMKTPRLKECQPLSLVNALFNASRLGLEIGQHAHLVPFRNNKLGITECVLIPDYRGLIGLAVRSGKVKHIDARVVYKDDEFDYQLGSAPFIKHKPKLDGDRSDGNIFAFYSVAHLVDGTPVFDEPMSKAEVDAVRARSRAKDDGPWVTDYVAMGKKTVVKRAAKFLPQSPEFAAAIELDNRAETGEISTVSDIIDSRDSLNAQVAQSTQEKLNDLKDRMEPAAESTGKTEPGDGAPGNEEARTPLTSPSAAAPAPTKKNDDDAPF